MDAVAARAKASKATLYRRWNNKVSLVIDALPRPQSSTRGPGHRLAARRPPAGRSAASAASPTRESVATFASVLTAIARDPEFAEAFRRDVVGPKIAASRQIWERARDRGELRPDVDLDLLDPALAGIVLHRVFVMGEQPDRGPRSPASSTRSSSRPPLAPQPRPTEPATEGHLMTDVRSRPRRTPRASSLHLGWALVLISVAQLMVVLDGTIVNIALPFIQAGPRHRQANLTWVVTGYALAFGGLLLLGGRLGDLYGRRRIFMIGLVDLRRRLAARRPRHQRGHAARRPGACRASAPRSPRPPRSR